MNDVVNQSLLEHWQEFRNIVDAVEQDINKNAAGNAAAGVRARKVVRLLKKKLGEIVKVSLESVKKDKK
jgi:hypothetical protein